MVKKSRKEVPKQLINLYMHVLGCMPILDKTSIAVGKAEKSDKGQHKPWENGGFMRFS